MAKDDFGDDEIQHFDVSKSDGEKIENSLAKIKYQTSRHLCINTGLSIGTVVEWLEGNSFDVLGEQVGGFWVYYLKENKPAGVKLYFGGADGRTVCLREQDERGNTGPLEIGQTVVLDLPKPVFDQRKPPLEIQNLPPLDLRYVERLAAENPDPNYIADELDVEPARFKRELATNENLQRAVERGKQTFMKNQKPDEKTNEPKLTAPESSAKSEISRAELRKRLTAEYFENAAQSGKSTAKIAVEMGLTKQSAGVIDGILYDKAHPELNQAWKRGKAMRERKPPSADTVAKARPVREKTFASLADNSVAPPDFVIPEKPMPEAQPPIELPESGDFDETITSELTGEAEAIETNFIPIEITPENFTPLPEAELEDDPPPEENHEIIADADRREKLDEVRNKLMPQRKSFFGDEVEFLGRVQIAKIPAGLNVGFSGDFFALSEKQRMLLCEMANLNDEFQKEEN